MCTSDESPHKALPTASCGHKICFQDYINQDLPERQAPGIDRSYHMRKRSPRIQIHSHHASAHIHPRCYIKHASEDNHTGTTCQQAMKRMPNTSQQIPANAIKHASEDNHTGTTCQQAMKRMPNTSQQIPANAIKHASEDNHTGTTSQQATETEARPCRVSAIDERVQKGRTWTSITTTVPRMKRS